MGATDPVLLAGMGLAKSNFDIFANRVLKIRTMDGRLAPLIFNSAQMHAHRLLEQQLHDIGKVRALIVKARKQGMSTYVGARFYHKVAMNAGVRARVIAHKQDSTDDLFEIVHRYHAHNPLAAKTKTSSTKEIMFGGLDSAYKVNTAGSSDVGRGGTAQLLHASEFAYWQRANEQMAAIGNVVADVDGTEVIIESTGNGEGNAFHSLWSKAEAGEGEFIPIFIPWYWEPRYRAVPKPDMELTEADELYMRAYSLDLEQMAWRANKIATYERGFEWLFDREFPATPALAFISATTDPLISPHVVARAMASQFAERWGAFIIGADPHEGGDDRAAIVWRHGRVVPRVESYANLGPMEMAGKLARYWVEGDERGRLPDAIFIDQTNSVAIRDRLVELGVPAVAIKFSESAHKQAEYINKRTEMWFDMRDWLLDEPVRLPKDTALASDLSAPKFYPASDGRMALEKKKEMKARGVRSPDLGDALALTFAEAVVPHRSAGAPLVQVMGGHQPASDAGY